MNKQIRLAIILPLIALNATWVIFWFANMAAHLEGLLQVDALGNWIGAAEVRASTFLYLAGIATFAIVATVALRVADEQQLKLPHSKPAHAAFRFASLAVILGLVAGAVYAIGTFMSSFDSFRGTSPTLTGRLVGTYLPIVLATALEIWVLLRATVFRKSSHNEAEEGKGVSSQQKAMVLGYSLPILATALGIIIGLAFWDIQGQSLDAWVWVLIQALIAIGIVLGTRFAMASKSEAPAELKPRMRNAAALGAINLNYVLSIVFAGVVTLMSFIMSADSFSPLGSEQYKGTDFAWFVAKVLPAYLLLVFVTYGVYATISLRHRAENAFAGAALGGGSDGSTSDGDTAAQSQSHSA